MSLTSDPVPPTRRERVVIVALGLLILAAAAGGLLWLLHWLAGHIGVIWTLLVACGLLVAVILLLLTRREHIDAAEQVTLRELMTPRPDYTHHDEGMDR